MVTQEQVVLVIKEVPNINLIQLLNGVQVMLTQLCLERLFYIWAILIRVPTNVLIDSRATHNFLSHNMTCWLHLSLKPSSNNLKVVNLKVKPPTSLTHCVDTQVGD